MVNNQNKFFMGLGFEQHEFNGEICFKGPDNGFYRIDHFSKVYVIEYAENEEDARLNRFEDTDLYDDSLPEEELIKQIQNDLKVFVNETA